jgi:hypothetical protein
MRTLLYIALITSTVSAGPIEIPSAPRNGSHPTLQASRQRLDDRTYIGQEGVFKGLTVRKWTAYTGETMEAAYIRYVPSYKEVILMDAHGTKAKVPVTMLSSRDKQWVVTEFTARKKFRRRII